MKMYLNSIKTRFSLSLEQQSPQVAVFLCECEANGWPTQWGGGCGGSRLAEPLNERANNQTRRGDQKKG